MAMHVRFRTSSDRRFSEVALLKLIKEVLDWRASETRWAACKYVIGGLEYEFFGEFSEIDVMRVASRPSVDVAIWSVSAGPTGRGLTVRAKYEELGSTVEFESEVEELIDAVVQKHEKVWKSQP